MMQTHYTGCSKNMVTKEINPYNLFRYYILKFSYRLKGYILKFFPTHTISFTVNEFLMKLRNKENSLLTLHIKSGGNMVMHKSQ